MAAKTWLDEEIESSEDSFEFRLEYLILELTAKITEAMEERKINRSQLAKLLNVTPAAVTKILNGTSNFTLRTLLSLADTLDYEFKPDLIAKVAPCVKEAQVPSVYYTQADEEPKVKPDLGKKIETALSSAVSPNDDFSIAA